MLIWTSWFNLRLRFFYSLAVLLFLLATITAIYPLLISLKTEDPYEQALIQRISQDYVFYIDRQWFGSNGIIAFHLITIGLALGGIPAERGKGVLMMALSLPVKRRLWVVAHAGMAAFLVLVLAFISPVCAGFGSLIFTGKFYPNLLLSLLPVLRTWLPCFPLIGLSILLNSYLRSAIKSALILILFILNVPSIIAFISPAFYRLSPWALESHGFWMKGIPWMTILIALLIGIGSTALAAYRFAHEEF
jgi:ABC-type transport system involved in multi-copper enzyme maturation permease subunit